jgi:hypothetical protein
MNSIAVIPYTVYQSKVTGQKISKFSTYPDGNPNNWERIVSGFTWGITDSRGTYTEGLCRAPAKTADEANEIALKVARPNTEVTLWVEL